jgi:hypothetical protein
MAKAAPTERGGCGVGQGAHRFFSGKNHRETAPHPFFSRVTFALRRAHAREH